MRKRNHNYNKYYIIIDLSWAFVTGGGTNGKTNAKSKSGNG